MDINSLLSPQEPAALEGPPPKTSSGSLASLGGPYTQSQSQSPKQTSSSSRSRVPPPPPPPTRQPSYPFNVAAASHHGVQSPPLTSPTHAQPHGGSDSNPSTEQSRPSSSRQPSTPGMDTLADLASMQHHQHAARSTANGFRSTDVYDSKQRPSPQAATPRGGVPRAGRSSTDLGSINAPRHPSPARPLISSYLPESDLKVIAQLVSYLAENSYAYQSHVQLVGLLHRGFVSFLQTSSTEGGAVDPHGYDLLPDLRRAREAMEARFPVGEDLWADWIVDEARLARNLEDRVAVMELCQRAVVEENGSTTLWLLYAHWMSSLFNDTHPDTAVPMPSDESVVQHSPWTAEERTVGAELFGWDVVMDVWRQAISATGLRISDSHLLWDKYADILIDDLATTRDVRKLQNVKTLFNDRLRVPHATWDSTFQRYSTLITTYDNKSYEALMIEANKNGQNAKSKYDLREMHELSLKRAMAEGDRVKEWAAFAEYLDWEIAHLGKKTGDLALCNALFERATLRYATEANLWEDYVFCIIERTKPGSAAVALLPVLQRATRHCPWSGTLWSQYLLSLERENQSFQELEEVKHKATSTGLMDIGGMEEVLKVHAAWCGYLNRRAFHEKATDEEADVAEVGIRSALESVKELGERKYGKSYEGDPNYRLERIYVQYLTRSGLCIRARDEVWRPLAGSKGNSYDFWLRWYFWEMNCWSRRSSLPAGNNIGQSKPGPTPSEASLVLRQALRRQNLDWPERIMEVYIQHAEDYETVDELQRIMIQVRRMTKELATRREQEAADAAAAQQAQLAGPALDEVAEEQHAGKRKREHGGDATEETASKKTRPATQAKSHPETVSLKRDRENTTVIVKNLPVGTTDTKVRQYFRDCGIINSIKLVPEEDDKSATATIEFESKDDVLSAQTKDMKMFDGNEIEIQVGSGSSLFVTNFPATADEKYIRDLFREYGEIVDVRFPSLKYNTHRRFCYVQFRSSGQANSATELDGKIIDELALVAKISDPARKQNRSGAVYEGREIYIADLDWSATTAEITSIFSKYGTVEKVRIPTNMAGKSKGTAFVVFSTKEEAEAALDMDMTKFKRRVLKVSLAVSNPGKRQATTIVRSNAASPAPSGPEGRESVSQQGSPEPGGGEGNHPSRAEIASRTFALMNLPDTVNDARVRALVEPYGELKKIVLRPDHQGAIVEFAEVQAVGKATLAVDGQEIAPGRTVKIGTVKDLLSQKAEVKSDRIGKQPKATGAAENNSTGLAMQQNRPIQRPQQAGGRRGGKGGLGFKHGGATRPPGAQPRKDGDAGPSDEGASSDKGKPETAKKSNADFRAMLTK